MILELNAREEEVLRTILDSYESELRGEIVKTDVKDFRDTLHGEEKVVKEIINKLMKKAA